MKSFSFMAFALSSATFYKTGKLSWESKFPISFSNGHRAQCYFNLSRYALRGEGRQILGTILAGPAKSQFPPSPAVHESRHLPDCSTAHPISPRVHRTQHFENTMDSILWRMPEEALKWVVNHCLNCLSLLIPVLIRAQPWGCMKRSSVTQDQP